MTIERPMLAATCLDTDLERVEWPMWCSPKIDGIRVLIHPELGPVTRSFKPLPNVYARELLQKHIGGSYLDGELITYNSDSSAKPFNAIQSDLMSRGGRPLIRYVVFDCFQRPDVDFAIRHNDAASAVMHLDIPFVDYLEHQSVHNVPEFIWYVANCLRNGYEGAVMRAPGGIYKNGRSTLRQGWMLKYKNWQDTEGTVIGFEEMYHNENPQEADEFGLAKRSSHKAGKIAGGLLGALVVKTEWGELRIGSGFTMSQRKAIWDRNKGAWPSTRQTAGQYLDQPGVVSELCPDIGRKVTFKYQSFGMDTLPRFPIFKSFRDDE